MLTRRETLAGLAAVAGAAALAVPFPAWAQAATVSTEELAKAGPLGDVALGPAEAPVTIIEYASLTCPHCATFHKTTLPVLKERYVDTGKVRFILREFPLDPLATAGFMLARCNGNEKYYPITDLLFEQQRSWAYADKPLDALRQLMRQAGFSNEKFEECLRDQKLYEAVMDVRKRGEDAFGVSSTPTFFINGQRRAGSMTIDEIEAAIKPIIGG